MNKNEINLIVQPKHTNALGTLFGGEMLAQMDICAAITARRLFHKRKKDFDHIVTLHAVIDFKKPAVIGDMVTIYGEVIGLGSSSIKVKIDVSKEDEQGSRETMGSGVFVMCTVKDGKSHPHTLSMQDTKEDVCHCGQSLFDHALGIACNIEQQPEPKMDSKLMLGEQLEELSVEECDEAIAKRWELLRACHGTLYKDILHGEICRIGDVRKDMRRKRLQNKSGQ